MKKLIFVLIILAIFGINFSIAGGGVAHAVVSESECDEVFISTINELLEAENANDTLFAASKTILYDIDLEPFGYLYSFTANSETGFAIVINSNGIYECVEIYFSAVDPYGDLSENVYCLYVNMMTYWAFSDGIYYDAIIGEILPAIIVDAARVKAYYSSTVPFVIVPETIYYTYRSEVKYSMVNKHPQIASMIDGSGCVPIMGANFIQFFDRYSTNLIANYTPGNTIGTIYRYKLASNETAAVATQLFHDMGTVNGGTTQAQFISGMAKYCSNRGYTFTYTICMTSGQFNYNAAKIHMQEGRPIALFVDPYSIESIYLLDGYDTIEHRYFTAAHSLAVFGYREITYTLTNGQSRSDSYLQVATGNQIISSGYCKISNNLTIDQALAISIN